ncbi:hypothetical protein [Fulvimonas yonginensis]|uniref:Uncharacterized protein n=1 Tax=Fulvimonas yonginensis TaxID=1495200 RepID=A0ABU8JE71_9GAMM
MSWWAPASAAAAGLGRRLLLAVGIAWASPTTLPGLLAGCVGLLLGARAYLGRRERALVFARMPSPWRGALTLGNVILHTGDSLEVACCTYAHRAGRADEPLIRLADHERAHVYQAMVLGPLFLPVYLLCGGVSGRNPLERAADRHAGEGRGWWPWAVRARGGAHCRGCRGGGA